MVSSVTVDVTLLINSTLTMTLAGKKQQRKMTKESMCAFLRGVLKTLR